MSDEPTFRRRIDRVTSEDFLDDLGDRSMAEVREMRDACREEESRLSYARRLLHGQLDIARAELVRRDAGAAGSLISTLGSILADDAPAGPQRSASNADLYLPTMEEGRREGDRVLDGMPLAVMPDMSDQDLIDAVSHLAEQEQAISATRRIVIDHLDRLQGELVDRYRDGAASVDDLVPPRTD